MNVQHFEVLLRMAKWDGGGKTNAPWERIRIPEEGRRPNPNPSSYNPNPNALIPSAFWYLVLVLLRMSSSFFFSCYACHTLKRIRNGVVDEHGLYSEQFLPTHYSSPHYDYEYGRFIFFL